jgi:hypothetical protein
VEEAHPILLFQGAHLKEASACFFFPFQWTPIATSPDIESLRDSSYLQSTFMEDTSISFLDHTSCTASQLLS